MGGVQKRYRTSLEDSARWQGFRFRAGDIVISTPSKSGTTWTQMICALLVFQTADLPAPLTTLSPWMDMLLRPVSEVHAGLEAQRHRRFIKTHTPLDGLPHDDRVTYVVVGRDPRDLAVSLLHHGDNLRRDVVGRLLGETPDDSRGRGPRPEGDLRSRLLRWMDSDEPVETNLDTLRGMVWHLAGAWERRGDANVVLLHYGDLERDLELEMRRQAARLDIAIDQVTWPALVEAATFGRMKERAADLVPDERLGILKETSTFFRSGASGQWHQWLTANDLIHYDERLAALTKPELANWLHHGWLGERPHDGDGDLQLRLARPDGHRRGGGGGVKGS